MNSRLNRVATFFVLLLSVTAPPARATVLWSMPGPVTVHENGQGTDILGGAVKRTKKEGDALYFKFHVNPLSDVSQEEYFAGFQLFEGDT